MVRKELIDNARAYYPFLLEQAVGFTQASPFDLIIRLNDGSAMLYDDLNKSFRTLPKDSRNMSERECKNEFGNRLRTIMYRKGMTQQELGELSGIPQPVISSYISGKTSPTFYRVDRIAKALGCSIDDLTYRD